LMLHSEEVKKSKILLAESSFFWLMSRSFSL
jgi:hypothetical protein